MSSRFESRWSDLAEALTEAVRLLTLCGRDLVQWQRPQFPRLYRRKSRFQVPRVETTGAKKRIPTTSGSGHAKIDLENIDHANQTCYLERGWSFFVFGMIKKVLIADSIAWIINPALV